METVLGLGYGTWKFIHITGAVLLLGNIVVTGVWKGMADAGGDPRVLPFAQRLVTLTDWLFTAGGTLLIVAGGTALAWLGGWWRAPWFLWGVGLFTLSGVLWGAVLIPVQTVQARLARPLGPTEGVPARYWRLARLWYAAGVPAIVLPLCTLYLMVVKP